MKSRVYEEEKHETKLTIDEFMRESTNITDEMFNAGQPFAGFISNGVYDRYIQPLKVKKNNGAIAGRLHDIAWMSAPFRNWGPSAADVRKQVETDVLRKFPVLIGDQEVVLYSLYNTRDCVDGWIACLIMLPKEAKRFVIEVPDEQNDSVVQQSS